MSNQIELIERAIEMAVEDLVHGTESILNTLGERPFLTEPKTDEEKVLEYKQMRAEPYSMWYRAEDIRKELEERLAGMEPEEREFRGVSEDAIRKLAYDMTLKYASDMVQLAKKLGIPVVGSEELPPPPLVDESLGGEEWQELMTPPVLG